MSKAKNYLTLSLALAMAIFMLSMVSAAVAVQAPLAGTNHSTAISILATYVNNTDISDPIVDEINVSYSIDNGATWTQVSVTGETVNDTTYSSTLAITSIADNANVDLNVSFGNATEGSDTANATAVVEELTIDDAAPTLITQQTAVSNGRTVQYQCNDDVDSTLTVTAYHPSGDSTSTTTLTGGNISNLESFEDTDYAGDYIITCTDYTGNSATNITVKSGELGHSIAVQQPSAKQGGMNTNMLLIIGGVIILALWMSNKK